MEQPVLILADDFLSRQTQDFKGYWIDEFAMPLAVDHVEPFAKAVEHCGALAQGSGDPAFRANQQNDGQQHQKQHDAQAGNDCSGIFGDNVAEAEIREAIRVGIQLQQHRFERAIVGGWRETVKFAGQRRRILGIGPHFRPGQPV